MEGLILDGREQRGEWRSQPFRPSFELFRRRLWQPVCAFELSPFQLQITVSVREWTLRTTWVTIAAPTLPAAAIREPTLFSITETGFTVEFLRRPVSFNSSSSGGGGSGGKSHLMRKLEERNVCISNAKQRWNFLKTSTLVKTPDEVDPVILPSNLFCLRTMHALLWTCTVIFSGF